MQVVRDEAKCWHRRGAESVTSKEALHHGMMAIRANMRRTNANRMLSQVERDNILEVDRDAITTLAALTEAIDAYTTVMPWGAI